MEEDKPDKKRPKVEEGNNQLPISAEEPTITLEFSTDLPGGTSRDDFNIESSSAVSAVKHGYTRIPNLGNTCCLSTIIQCLANCPPMKKYFLSELFKDEVNGANPLGCKGVLAGAVYRIMTALWKTGVKFR